MALHCRWHTSAARQAGLQRGCARTCAALAGGRAARVKARSTSSSTSTSSTSGNTCSAVEHLVMTVDGLHADKATELCPELAQLSPDAIQAALDAVSGLLPQRILGSTLTQHPQLLTVDVASWLEFLTSFGLTRAGMQELLRASPEVLYRSSIFSAGQLLLFLRQDLALPEDAVLKHLKWAAALQPSTTQASMRAVAAALQSCLGAGAQGPEQLLPLLQAFPEVLGWSVEGQLLPRLAFFQGLGPAGQKLLRGTLWDPETGYIPGLQSWSYSVAPKLQLLADMLGDEEQARQLVASCPTVLKLPVESKLQPLLAALTALGLDGEQVAQLLRECPKLLAESKDGLVSRINFLLDAIGGTSEDLLAYPGYVLLSLEDVIGPRYYFLARHPGWCDALSDARTGSLALRRVMEPPLEEFLQDVAQVTGASRDAVEGDYVAMAAEWSNLLGWCCEKAFSNLQQVNSMYTEQVELFYLLVQ